MQENQKKKERRRNKFHPFYPLEFSQGGPCGNCVGMALLSGQIYLLQNETDIIVCSDSRVTNLRIVKQLILGNSLVTLLWFQETTCVR